MKLAISNTYTKGKRLNAATEDRISGHKLSTKPSLLQRRTKGRTKLGKESLVRKLDSSRADLTPEDAADAALIRPHFEGPTVRVKLESVSGDFIYNPGTQSTMYSATRAIKSNLERRIPGSVVKVHDVGGDGLVKLSLSLSSDVEGQHVEMVARSLASPHDMTIISANLVCGERVFDIDPVDQSRSPEDTATFLQRLAANCVFGNTR